MAEAYIVGAVRTAGGRRGGALSGIHANDLGAKALNAVVERSGVDPDSIEDVIMGCVTQAGEQSSHIGRHCVLASDLPEKTPAVSIDRQCGSSQQSIHFATQAILSGTQDVVIAAGVESMSRAPMGSSTLRDHGVEVISDTIKDRYSIKGFSQFGGAEMIAKKHGFSREDMDNYGLRSHQKAAAAVEADAFGDEIVPVEITTPDGERKLHTTDEGIRYNANPEGMAGVKLLKDDGRLTAATSSQICDGSSAVLIMSERAVKAQGLTPLA
ncbi:MAG: acetyl-CoA C-acyltransferase, partial [Pacificimonas sp.]